MKETTSRKQQAMETRIKILEIALDLFKEKRNECGENNRYLSSCRRICRRFLSPLSLKRKHYRKRVSEY